MKKLEELHLGVIGVGTIGGTLIEGLINNQVMDRSKIRGSTAHQKTMEEKQEKYGIETTTDNKEIVKDSDVVVLAVKPQVMEKVMTQIGEEIRNDQLVVTLAAAVTTKYLEGFLGPEVPVVRAMPNTAATVKAGMTVICPGKFAGDDDLDLARQIFSPVSKVETLQEEKLMDAVTGLSGSGPAYGYLIIEALIEAGVKVGLPRKLANVLASQSLLGAAKMVLETGEHPAKLKDMVTTPAGVTVDGIMKLEEGGVRVALIKAIAEATDKSGQLNFD